MSAALSLEVLAVSSNAALAHHCMADDESRTFLFSISSLNSLTDSYRVGTVYFNNVPMPSTIFCGSVLGSYIVDIS